MVDRFEPVVDVQLWCHLDETKHVYAANSSIQKEGVIAFVLVVVQGIYGVKHDQRVHDVTQVVHGLLVVLLRSRLEIGLLISQSEVREGLLLLELGSVQ